MKAMVLGLGLAAVLAAVIGLSLGVSPNEAQAQSGPAAPANVRAANGDTPGQAVVRWDAVADAAYYRIGWVNMETFRAVQEEGDREWLDVFAFHDVVNRGQTDQTIPDLAPGVEYAFIAASVGPSLWQRGRLVGLDLPDYGDGGGYILSDGCRDDAGCARRQRRSDANAAAGSYAGGYRYPDGNARAYTDSLSDAYSRSDAPAYACRHRRARQGL